MAKRLTLYLGYDGMVKGDKMKLQLMGDIFAGLIAASVFLFSALMLKPAKAKEKSDENSEDNT